MSYKKAKNLLPADLMELIQNYVEGETIYIPRRNDQKKKWGSNTAIYNDYLYGIDIAALAMKYYLSAKSIQRIVLTERRK